MSPESGTLEDLLGEEETSASPDSGTGRRSHPVRKAALGLLACGLVLGALVLAGLAWTGHRLDSNIERIPGVFEGLDHRPPRASGPAAEAMNILLLGTDRRSDVPTTGNDAGAAAWVPGAQRSDTMMILHIDADRDGASIVSIPRDTWVEVPGLGWAKINAAYSWGGPSLAVETVENFTGVRIDHLAIIDWAGFAELVDAVGGIDVTVPVTVRDSIRNITWTAGEHHLDGEQALAYVGQRYGLPFGDLDRIARQQAVLRTLMQTALEGGITGSPGRLYDFVDTITRHLSVDSGWSGLEIAKLAFSLRDVRSGDVTFLSMPVAGFGNEAGQSVVYADARLCGLLWSAVREDGVVDWAESYPEAVIPSTVR